MRMKDPEARRDMGQFLSEHRRDIARVPFERRLAMYRSPEYREYCREQRELLARLHRESE